MPTIALHVSDDLKERLKKIADQRHRGKVSALLNEFVEIGLKVVEDLPHQDPFDAKMDAIERRLALMESVILKQQEFQKIRETRELSQ
jgi:hypothetical protein